MRFFTSLLVVACLSVDAGRPPAAAQDAPKKAKGKFTVSKETTYVTGPLDKAGYIDYAAALNERMSKGVTPANNANVLLLQKVFGPHPEGAEMPPAFFKWLGIEPPPKKGDYLIDAGKHAKKNEEIDPSKKAADIFDDYYDRSGRPWKATQYPHVAGWLTVNEKPLAAVLEATKRSHYFSPLVPKDTDKGPSGLIASLLPAVQKCRELANMLTARGMLRVGERRYDEAWQDLLACHRLARHVGRGGTLIESLVSIAIDAIASHADLVFLEHAKLDAKRLQACLSDLQALPPLPSIADKVDLAERFMFLDSVMMLDRYGTKAFQGLVGQIQEIPAAVADRILDGIDWDPALRNANRWYDRLAAALRMKERADRQKQLDQIETELKKLKASLGDAEAVVKLLMDEKQGPQAKAKLVGDGLVTLLLPAVRKVDQAADRAEQTQRNLQVAFALAMYQREHGAYPKALDALAPKYLARVPDDIFSGKPLTYRLGKKGYIFYSVGANGIDEGGRWYDDTPAGDDPRVIMPLPPPRKQ